MRVTLTPRARSYLADLKVSALTVSSLVFSSCCSGPLPPEVRPGAPADADGFAVYPAGELLVYFDSLLDPRPEMVIDLKEFPSYRELFVREWD